MEMSHLEVLNVWSLSDAPNPAPPGVPCHLPGTEPSGGCGSQTQKMGYVAPAGSVVTVPRGLCHRRGLCSHRTMVVAPGQGAAGEQRACAGLKST